MTTVAAHLKAATEALHRQTEATMPTDQLLGGAMSVEGYGSLLRQLYTVHEQLEGAIEQQLTEHPQLANYFYPKLQWLKEDLVALNASLPPSTPSFQASPESAARLAGKLYVLEGSTLGGQVILKGLKKNQALSHFPHHYYTGYGPMTGVKWKSFMEMLEREVSPTELEEAVDGAKEAFQTFMSVMSGTH